MIVLSRFSENGEICKDSMQVYLTSFTVCYGDIKKALGKKSYENGHF